MIERMGEVLNLKRQLRKHELVAKTWGHVNVQSGLLFFSIPITDFDDDFRDVWFCQMLPIVDPGGLGCRCRHHRHWPSWGRRDNVWPETRPTLSLWFRWLKENNGSFIFGQIKSNSKVHKKHEHLCWFFDLLLLHLIPDCACLYASGAVMDETLGSGVVSEKVGEILFDEGQVPVLVSPPFGVFQATDLTMKEKIY